MLYIDNVIFVDHLYPYASLFLSHTRKRSTHTPSWPTFKYYTARSLKREREKRKRQCSTNIVSIAVHWYYVSINCTCVSQIKLARRTYCTVLKNFSDGCTHDQLELGVKLGLKWWTSASLLFLYQARIFFFWFKHFLSIFWILLYFGNFTQSIENS